MSDNSTGEFFKKSQGGGIDNDNFTKPGSGEGFDAGKDFTPPATEESRSNSDSTSEDNNSSDNDNGDSDFIREAQDRQLAESLERSRSFDEGTLDNRDLVFDEQYYLEQNPDLRGTGIEPLTHFSQHGASEEREYRFQLSAENAQLYQEFNSQSDAANSNINLTNRLTGFVANSGISITGTPVKVGFDDQYYLEQNPDVAAAGMDAQTHFYQSGALENREHRYVSRDRMIKDTLLKTLSPTAQESELYSHNEFDRQYYLEENPDVAAAGIDPYQHYTSTGMDEGRSPNALYDLFQPELTADDTNRLDISDNSSI